MLKKTINTITVIRIIIPRSNHNNQYETENNNNNNSAVNTNELRLIHAQVLLLLKLATHT